MFSSFVTYLNMQNFEMYRGNLILRRQAVFSFASNFLLLFSEPGAPPQSVTGYNTSSTSIIVSWGEVPADKQLGDIIRYSVIYRKIPGGAETSKTVTLKTAELGGLE